MLLESWGYLCVSLVKNMVGFCLCFENLNEVLFKDKELICLVDEILVQENIQVVLQWLFIIFIKVYNERD